MTFVITAGGEQQHSTDATKLVASEAASHGRSFEHSKPPDSIKFSPLLLSELRFPLLDSTAKEPGRGAERLAVIDDP